MVATRSQAQEAADRGGGALTSQRTSSSKSSRPGRHTATPPESTRLNILEPTRDPHPTTPLGMLGNVAREVGSTVRNGFLNQQQTPSQGPGLNDVQAQSPDTILRNK